MIGAFVPTAALAIAAMRRIRWVRHALPILWAALVPVMLAEPFVSKQTALAMVGPPMLAALTAGPRTIAACAVLPFFVVVARVGTRNAYLDVQYIGIYLVLIAILALSQWTLQVVVAHATRSARLFDALTRETNEVVTLSGPGKSGDNAAITFMSPSVTRVLGYPENEPDKLKWAEVIHPDDVDKIARLSSSVRAHEGNSDTAQFRMRHKDGTFRWMVARATNLLHLPHVRGVLSSFVDVTNLVEERQEVERKLEHEARHDAATGLPNRRMLHDDLRDALTTCAEGGRRSLIFVDIDGFKRVNDSLGHDFGDRLIVAIAERFRPDIPDGAGIYRFGGDELCVLSECDGDVAEVVAEKLLESVRLPFTIEERNVFVTASIGVTVVHPEHDRPEAVLQEADLAMYRAKERGRNMKVRFDRLMRERADRRHDVEQALRGALEAGQLRVVYQPRVGRGGLLVTGFEALLRFKHPTLGNVGPDEFIPIAEETGLIDPIGRWVLEQACKQLAAWKVQFPRHSLHMAVNLSGRQLHGASDVVADVRAILAETGVEASCLELEVTESVLLDRAGQAVARLAELQELGVQIAIDDFGTGYSSLAYLRELPVDVLKIDRAFVARLDKSKEDAAIARLIVTLAEALGLTTVAEGVEHPSQRDALLDLGCHQLQGFFFARPLELEAASEYLAVAPNVQDEESGIVSGEKPVSDADDSERGAAE
jgi:diguanylate cyclase (GGDEF)-like protein/PAS domain S-box-containing protein